MKKPDIQLVITSLAPEPIQHQGKSGGDVRLLEILRRLDKNFSLDILCVTTPYNRKFFEENKIRTEFRVVNSNLKFSGFVGLCLKSVLNILKALFVLKLDFLENKEKKVVLYSSSDLFWEVLPNYFFKIRKKNIKWVQPIYHVYPDWKKRHGNKMINFFGYYLQRFSFFLIRKKADKIVLINSIVRNELKEMGFQEDKMIVSSVGIDAEYFDRVQTEGPVYDGIFLARLSQSKGIIDLIEIWKKVCKNFPESKLAVIGGGNQETKKAMSKKIEDYGLENNIDILGFLDNKKTHAILKSGRVFLFPSHEEGWGIAISEAMACGLPVVSWDLPVFKQIFEDRTIQIKENDIEMFSKKVIELLKNDTLRNETGRKGKEFIERYSWDKVAEKEFEIIVS